MQSTSQNLDLSRDILIRIRIIQQKCFCCHSEVLWCLSCLQGLGRLRVEVHSIRTASVCWPRNRPTTVHHLGHCGSCPGPTAAAAATPCLVCTTQSHSLRSQQNHWNLKYHLRTAIIQISNHNIYQPPFCRSDIIQSPHWSCQTESRVWLGNIHMLRHSALYVAALWIATSLSDFHVQRQVLRPNPLTKQTLVPPVLFDASLILACHDSRLSLLPVFHWSANFIRMVRS